MTPSADETIVTIPESFTEQSRHECDSRKLWYVTLMFFALSMIVIVLMVIRIRLV
jgi:hypothetical protein